MSCNEFILHDMHSMLLVFVANVHNLPFHVPLLKTDIKPREPKKSKNYKTTLLLRDPSAHYIINGSE